jgi:cobalamin biosynthesis Mg chelatase CobN
MDMAKKAAKRPRKTSSTGRTTKKATKKKKKKAQGLPKVRKSPEFVAETESEVKQIEDKDKVESMFEERAVESKAVDSSMNIILYAVFLMLLLFIFIIILRARFYP